VLHRALGVSHVAARALLTRARESLRQALADEKRQEKEREAAIDAAFAAKTRRSDPRGSDGAGESKGTGTTADSPK
jgi:hypothetical protein